MKFSDYFQVTKKERISDSVYRLVFRSPDITASAKPGQFVQIRTSHDYFPLWPRPFSIYDTDLNTGEFSIIFKIFGCGTSKLANLAENDKIHILGPLGNGFDLIEGDKPVIMAGGGVGIPPLYFLTARSIDKGYPAENITFISGAKTKKDHFDDGRLADLGINLVVCSDDGSYGKSGTVVDMLENELNDQKTVYACGPSGMLKKIDSLIKRKNTAGMLSLEALMPCGFGICSGCAIKTVPGDDRGSTDDNRDYHLKRVCLDGPVFKAGEVIWR
ncbi:MAG: dihydroorotate dehydrogenase electron transfer subunit [candidate division Zixibacteria bacterium]